ncbi:M15 family metallopeptidase [Nocardioides sp. AX2bis]|uniref:M15 family metallopeptidase n=1 Tax=Nocardioides sp. AX2bis TaxID=2653157 RepID=UPI0012F21B30|nr:M15 family metallopeptidase [Nocardioides sp. AX2bis]VXC47028.1 D-alanyl-D-alanine dipeptidase [Nocardioides sp. AX2bis]
MFAGPDPRRLARSLLTALLGLVVLLAPSQQVASAQPEPRTAPPVFVALDEVDPTILHDIRYTTKHNFVGRRIHAYRDPLCILTRPAAEALAQAQDAALARGYSLKVYDCYRPQTAVDDFVGWAERLRDDRMKAEFYPDVEKSALFEDGYIAARSGHSRGSTVDLTLVELPAVRQPRWRPSDGLVPCYAPYEERFPDSSVDMGTGYDCFDTLSNTLDPRVQGEARDNRLLLKSLLENAGFTNYANEWWHYTFAAEPFTDRYFDFPAARRALG